MPSDPAILGTLNTTRLYIPAIAPSPRIQDIKAPLSDMLDIPLETMAEPYRLAPQASSRTRPP